MWRKNWQLACGHFSAPHQKAVITPHHACNSREALPRILDTTVDQVLAIAGGKPINVVRD